MAQQLGWLDTNIFVSVLFPGDPNSARCERLVNGLRSGRALGWIDPLVIHELTHVLARFRLFPSRPSIHLYVQEILSLPGIQADDKIGLLNALTRWRVYGVDFVDAWIAVCATRRERRVCTINERDFRGITNTFHTARV